MQDKSFDDLVADIQKDILQQTEEQLGPAFLERWNNPEFMQEMEDPDTSAVLTGDCGDTMQIYLKLQGDTIVRANYFTSGCGASIVCGNTACELAVNKELEHAVALEGKDVLEVLGGLPEEHQHCAHLAAQTLREAIRLYWTRDGR